MNILHFNEKLVLITNNLHTARRQQSPILLLSPVNNITTAVNDY